MINIVAFSSSYRSCILPRPSVCYPKSNLGISRGEAPPTFQDSLRHLHFLPIPELFFLSTYIFILFQLSSIKAPAHSDLTQCALFKSANMLRSVRYRNLFTRFFHLSVHHRSQGPRNSQRNIRVLWISRSLLSQLRPQHRTNT